jgi:hypothetical protein
VPSNAGRSEFGTQRLLQLRTSLKKVVDVAAEAIITAVAGVTWPAFSGELADAYNAIMHWLMTVTLPF